MAIRTGTVRRVWFAIGTAVGILLAIVGEIFVFFDFNNLTLINQQYKRLPWAVFSFLKSIFQSSTYHIDGSGVASSISEGDIFIYSCSAQLISFEIKSILKKVNCAEHKYMNMSPSLIELATRY